MSDDARHDDPNPEDLNPEDPNLDSLDPGLTGGELPPMDADLAALLATDQPGPMPADVWSRLEAAIAAEPPFVAPTSASGETAEPNDRLAPVADLGAARTRRSSRLWPVLAGAAGVALVGLVALPALRGGDAPPVADGPITAEAAIDIPAPASITANSGAQSANDGGQGGEGQGSEPQVAEPAAPGSAAPTASAPSSSPSTADPTANPAPTAAGPAAAATPVALLNTGTAYSADAMPTQVGALMTAAGMTDSTSMTRAMGATSASVAPMTGTGMLASPEALHDCMLRLGLPESAKPLVVDHGFFDGRDAGLVVTVGATLSDGQPSDLHVVVVGTQCSEADVTAARHFDFPVVR